MQNRLGTIWGDIVDVDIDRWVDDLKSFDAGFFGRFFERDSRKVRFAVGVASGLQPALQLRVKHEERFGGIVVEHQRRSGEVTGRGRTVERPRLKRCELEELALYVLKFVDVNGRNVMPRRPRL